MNHDKSVWDERFRSGGYSRNPDPPPVLSQYVETFPDGTALDIATGTGRISVFHAVHGYAVDALDQSREGLEIARQNARDRGVASDIDWIQADALSFPYPAAEYAVITIRSFRIIDRLTDVKAALKPGGVLFYQDHLRTGEPMESGPSDDRQRVGTNELLRACLDLTVIHYKEFTAKDGSDAYAQIIARKPSGDADPPPARSAFQR